MKTNQTRESGIFRRGSRGGIFRGGGILGGCFPQGVFSGWGAFFMGVISRGYFQWGVFSGE